jgi:hypothetical protein
LIDLAAEIEPDGIAHLGRQQRERGQALGVPSLLPTILRRPGSPEIFGALLPAR